MYSRPKIGSRWEWNHLPKQGRKVERIIEKTFGVFVLYSELYEGKEVDMKITSLESWDKATKGQGNYLSALTQNRG